MTIRKTIAVFLIIFSSRMFLLVENGTWPSLGPRQKGEVRKVWAVKSPWGPSQASRDIKKNLQSRGTTG